MEPENLSCTKWVDNVLLQLRNTIGENQNLNAEEKSASFIGQGI